jgi:hypothetical protein
VNDTLYTLVSAVLCLCLGTVSVWAFFFDRAQVSCESLGMAEDWSGAWVGELDPSSSWVGISTRLKRIITGI